MTVGERMRKRRTELGYSQEEIAVKLGYKSRSSVNKMEMSRSLPINKVERVAEVLDCSPAYLMGWEDEQKVADQLSQLIHNDLYVEVFDRVDKMNDKSKRRLLKYADLLLEEQENDD